MEPRGNRSIVDANEAVARVAHLLSEVIAIYPITPASPMGEWADDRTAHGVTNLWGAVPEVIEMQSEAGAAGALHGAVTRGALGTTFTASQGLLLMLPNLYKIAGELTPAVVHVAARAVATHALSIFGDHSDVMAARGTGFAVLFASSVQEAADFAAVAHAATLESRVPFLHAFDGFRTSHEIAGISELDPDDLAALVSADRIAEHRRRGLDPDRPVLRGSAQNPDVFFQAREAASPFHAAVPGVVSATFDRLAERTGRRYGLVDYHGHPEASDVVVVMGSGAGAVREAVDAANAAGGRCGVAVVRLYRPFPTAELVAALPITTRNVAVLDRCKEPGAPAEPLHLDVIAALAAGADGRFEHGAPRVVGGRYGLGSKEFTPAMAAAVLANAAAGAPVRRFTVGIVDDVSHTSLDVDPDVDTDHAAVRAVFYGLGSDGTVGATKNTAKIVGHHGDREVQAYFVYDSKKSGSMTVSHLRVADRPIRSTYLISRATFVGVHHPSFLERVDVLECAAPGATVVLNTPHPPDRLWAHLPARVAERIVELDLKVFAIDAARVARDAGLAGRINTIMQVCFFALGDLMPIDDALAAIKESIRATYAKRGDLVVERNLAVVDLAVAHLAPVPHDRPELAVAPRRLPVPAGAPDFCQRVTAALLAGHGDLLPVSALPPDGTFPTATSQWERRGIAAQLPVWEPDLCIDCGKCAVVCPHAAVRLTVHEPAEHDRVAAAHPDADLAAKPFRSHDVPGMLLTIGVAPDDCTGCGVCVVACPAHDKSQVKRRALNMAPVTAEPLAERARWDAFGELRPVDPTRWEPTSVKASQLRRPLFEFSGACAGCGETPYLKLVSQLFGDRMIVANATGCSSIYGGNLPTTPWAVDDHGRGPAWSNSLFEDNAEFGLGIRLAVDAHRDAALADLRSVAGLVGADLAAAIEAGVDDRDDRGLADQRARVAELDRRLAELVEPHDATPPAAPVDPAVVRLAGLTGTLVHRSVWLVGGDGWAYDIGAGGLDHVLGSGRDVNVLVLDTEVYSNTGGQASKSTPRAAVAKFASAGKATPKKDLGLEAITYGDVYVARIALGANDTQAVRALVEAEAWPGPSLVIAYSTCIAHGIDMTESMTQQAQAVACGHWPLFRYHPDPGEHSHPFRLDSKPPSIPFARFAAAEARFALLARSDPARAAELARLAEADIAERWRTYEQMAGLERSEPGHAHHASPLAIVDEEAP